MINKTTGLGRVFDDTCRRGVLRTLNLVGLRVFALEREKNGVDNENGVRSRSRRLFPNEIPAYPKRKFSVQTGALWTCSAGASQYSNY